MIKLLLLPNDLLFKIIDFLDAKPTLYIKITCNFCFEDIKKAYWNFITEKSKVHVQRYVSVLRKNNSHRHHQIDFRSCLKTICYNGRKDLLLLFQKYYQKYYQQY